MPKTHARYALEHRRRMVELVRAGHSPEELAKEFEPTAQSIRNWVTQAERDAGRRLDGLTSEERQELTRLRRENQVLPRRARDNSHGCRHYSRSMKLSRLRERPVWRSLRSALASI
jgi:transposase